MGEEQGISIRARFDHAPTSLKGALILRGEDANPHQVVLSDVRLVAVDGTWDAGRALRLPGSTVDVAPRRDVFVPFEVGVADLDPDHRVAGAERHGARAADVDDGVGDELADQEPYVLDRRRPGAPAQLIGHGVPGRRNRCRRGRERPLDRGAPTLPVVHGGQVTVQKRGIGPVS